KSPVTTVISNTAINSSKIRADIERSAYRTCAHQPAAETHGGSAREIAGCDGNANSVNSISPRGFAAPLGAAFLFGSRCESIFGDALCASAERDRRVTSIRHAPAKHVRPAAITVIPSLPRLIRRHGTEKPWHVEDFRKGAYSSTKPKRCG